MGAEAAQISQAARRAPGAHGTILAVWLKEETWAKMARRSLSDEAAFLRRLTEGHGDGDPETQAEWANAVQEAVTEMGPGIGRTPTRSSSPIGSRRPMTRR